jgi:hypothetical protein
MAAWDRQIDADFRPDSYVMTDRKDKRNVPITSTEPRRGKETHATNPDISRLKSFLRF